MKRAEASTKGSEDSSDKDEQKSFLEDCSTVTQFWERVLPKVGQLVRASNGLPAAGDSYSYYASYPCFEEVMSVEGKRAYELAQRLFLHQGLKIREPEQTYGLEEMQDDLVDANDAMIERINMAFDAANSSGSTTKEQEFITAEVSRHSVAAMDTKKRSLSNPGPSGSAKTYRLLTARYVQRPQLKFKDKVDNSSRPFKPILKHKDNALVEVVFGSSDADHPYQHEIESLSYTDSQLAKPANLEVPQSLGAQGSSAAKLIDTLSGLEELCAHLEHQSEIAVDLEHHNYRSFLGFTCLVQISTRHRDVIVDALALRSDLYRLNKPFTDPTKVKVFHGAGSDIVWLQRDFGVYVVNMFDTFHAAQALGTARHSLAHLLQLYCGVQADKQYQRADWRVRPLPEEMLRYASEDTHYLLYIYDRMRQDLLQRSPDGSLLTTVLQRSKQTCLLKYKKPECTDEGLQHLYTSSKKIFNARQHHALRALFKWRNKTAREEDESLAFILPSHMLLQIADILPREPTGVLACCNPVPGSVRKYLCEIMDIVKVARQQAVTEGEEVKSQARRQRAQRIVWSPHEELSSPVELDKSAVCEDRGTSSTGESKTVGVVYMKETSILCPGRDNNGNVERTDANTKYVNLLRSLESPFYKYAPATDLLDSLPADPADVKSTSPQAKVAKKRKVSQVNQPSTKGQSAQSSSSNAGHPPATKKGKGENGETKKKSQPVEGGSPSASQFKKPDENFQAYVYTKADDELFIKKGQGNQGKQRNIKASKGGGKGRKEGSKAKGKKPKSKPPADDRSKSMSFKRK